MSDFNIRPLTIPNKHVPATNTHMTHQIYEKARFCRGYNQTDSCGYQLLIDAYIRGNARYASVWVMLYSRMRRGESGK